MAGSYKARLLRMSHPGMINWINLIALFLLTSFSLTFALANESKVRLFFLGFSSRELPLYMPMFVAFFVGFLGGLMALSFSRRKHKREIAYLRVENDRLTREVENRRNIPLQDDV